MAEYISEQILDKIHTELASIAGDGGTNYWYTPHVVRVPYFNHKEFFKTEYGNYLYLLRETGDDDINPAAAAHGGMAEDLDIWIMLVAQDTRDDKDPFSCWYVVAGSNDKLDFNDGGGEKSATLTAGRYVTGALLAAEIQTKMDALTTDTVTVSYDTGTRKFTIASDGGTLSLLWKSGANTATSIGADIGFDVSADDTGSTSYEADNSCGLLPTGRIRERMLGDVKKKLQADVTRGLSGSGWAVIDTSQWHSRRDFQEPPGWIVAELHCVVTYEYRRGSP